MSKFDSIVVGAGIVGSACALALARAGMRVALVEADNPGMGATAAAMGHIVILDDSPAQFRLTHYSQQLWKELANSLPPSCEYKPIGTLWIAEDDEEMGEIVRKHGHYGEGGVQTKILSPDQVYAFEPNLRSGLSAGLLVPSDCVVDAPAVAKHLAEQCIAAGGLLIHERAIAMGQGAVQLASGAVLQSNRIVNAAGEHAGRLTEGLPIRPRKGHLALTDCYPGLVRHQIVELGYLKSAHLTTEDSVAFNVQPRASGQILIGSSRQFDAENAEVDSGVLSRMLERAIRYLPMLEQIPVVRVWTGFRTATPDKLPLIGPWPHDESVFLATGHEGLGITTSLGTAELLAAQICGREAEISIEPYLPS
ncbi:MAG TPA: FAD-dependent oxidoreductase, partial [Acidobacteriaceae bacterium]